MGWAKRTSYVLATLAGAAAAVTCTNMSTAPVGKSGAAAGGAAGGATTQSATASRAAGQPGRGRAGAGAGAGAGGAGFGGAAGGGFGGGFAGGAGGRGRGTTRLDLPFNDVTLSIDDRLDDLIGRLTLDEKVGQMEMDAPAIDRLGISAYHWWNEALHGVGRNGEATVFPQAIGMAASWNPALHHDMAKVIADEGRAKHAEAIRRGLHSQYTGLDFWSPNINIFRDPRWGRGQETYGEDPYLTSRMGIAFVTGLQGDDPNYLETVATPKHFAVHSGPEPERHRFDAQPSDVDLFTTYLPAFEATVREGHAFSVMASYNAVDGTPATASPRLLTDILRNTWGFKGYVTSDVDSVSDVYQSHMFTESPEAAAAASVKAGCDLNGGTTYRTLSEAVRQGLLTEADINKSVRRLFAARFYLGEFDPAPTAADTFRNPYANIPPTANDTPEHNAVALNMARQSMVLLKNNSALPLSKNLRSIAVIGPNADSTAALFGNYNGTPSHPITILQGIRNAVPLSTQVMYVPGCPLVTEDVPLAEPVPAACFFTDAMRKTHGLNGTYFRSVFATDRPSRTRVDAAPDLNFPDQSAKDSLAYDQGFYVKWTGVLVPPVSGDYQLGFTGKDSFRLSIDGKVVVDEWYTGNRRSAGSPVHLEKDQPYNVLIEYSHPAAAGAAGGGPGGGGAPAGGAPGAPAPGTQTANNAVNRDTANIEFKWTRPAAGGQPGGLDGLSLYANAENAAKAADAVVVVLGITADLEREEAAVHNAGFSGGDRTSLDLPLVQERLLEAVMAAAGGGKPVILVLTNGSAMSVNWANDHVPAILEAWYPGQHGDAVADVLFGNYNPGGRLPVTFYKSVDDLPPFTSYNMQEGNGRTYRYFKGAPLYPFGYGLSYTKFDYSGLTITDNPSTTQEISVSVKVKNTGPVEGDEVVQLYVENPAAAAPMPAPPVALASTMSFSAAPVDVQAALESAARGALPAPKQLVSFQRLTLKPGEERTVEFTITPHQLGGALSQAKHINVPRTITVRAAPNSAAGAGLSKSVAITGKAAEADYKFVAPKVSEPAKAMAAN